MASPRDDAPGGADRGGPPGGVLELLLPGATPETLERAVRTTTFLRLLVHDAGGPEAESVHRDLAGAREELERLARRELDGALADLIHHALGAHLGPDAFRLWGPPRLSWERAWGVLADRRGGDVEPPGLPAPGEPPLEVARRLLAALGRAGEAGPWEARFVRAERGPGAGETRWRRLLEGGDLAFDEEVAAVAGVAECLLDRGRVLPARAWLEEHLHLVACDETLRRMAAWCALLAGDPRGAAELCAGLPPLSGSLPAPLVELRRRNPDWIPLLSGAEPPAAPPAAPPTPPRSRADLGASVLGVFVLGHGRSPIPILLDVAPALRHRVGAWLAGREGAATVSTEVEHRLVVSARPVVVRGEGRSPVRGALGPRTRALALVPVLHDRGEHEGEVAGWLHVECEHLLLPSPTRLVLLAQAWSGEVLAAGERPPTVPAEVRSNRPPGPAPDPDDPRAQAMVALFASLGMKTAQRRWWGVDVDAGGRARPVAGGGEGLGGEGERPGRGRALGRAIAAAATIRFDRPDPRLARRASAASGLVLPLVVGGRVAGALVVESARRRDFRGTDVERFEAEVGRAAPHYRAAQFRAWHRTRFGYDLVVPVAGANGRQRILDTVAAGRSPAAVLVAGPAGCGKEVLARWLHFEGPHRDGPLRVHPCGTEGADALADPMRAAPERGTLVLDEVGGLDPGGQARLLEHLERGNADRDRRLVAIRTDEGGAGGPPGLRGDLARRLDRLRLDVPPLRRRRAEIPALVRFLATRFAAEERSRPPTFPDGSLALLWRQAWPENVRQLEGLVYKLVLLHPGEEVGPGRVLSLARRFGLDLVRRLPSRHPDPADLEAALVLTRRGNGSWNRMRAALYLGWDPHTLLARMRDANLVDPRGSAPA